jgi:hypothetical protein
MTHVQCTTAGTTSSVQEEWFALFVPLEDEVKVAADISLSSPDSAFDLPVREEGAPSQQRVRLSTRQALKLLKELLADISRTPLLDDLIVVTALVSFLRGHIAIHPHSSRLAIRIRSALNVEGCNLLILPTRAALGRSCRLGGSLWD